MKNLTLSFLALAALLLSGAPRTAQAVDQKFCNDIGATEADGVWQYIDKDTMGDCNSDEDCVQFGLVGYGCGAIANRTASDGNTAYVNTPFYQTLVAKDREIGCPHFAPPCAYIGRPGCRANKCQGVYN